MGRSAMDVVLDRFEKKKDSWTIQPAKLKCGKWTISVKDDALYDEIGRSELCKQVYELQKEGLLLKGGWYQTGSELEEIRYSPDKMVEFYRRTGRKPKYDTIQEMIEQVEATYGRAMEAEVKPWIRKFLVEVYDSLLNSLQEKGEIKKSLFSYYVHRDIYIKTILALSELREPIYRRHFSKKYLGDSKSFEQKQESDWSIQKQVINDAKKYHPIVSKNKDVMRDDEILQQLFIETYHQELAIKGGLRIWLNNKLVDTADFCYGVVLNAETLRYAKIDDVQVIKRVITIENKANFVEAAYEKDTLIVFSHGFFSPKERQFLIELKKHLNEEVEYYHSGDLDLGGMRIYIDIKSIFPKLKPLHMDQQTYLANIKEAEECTSEYLKKVQNLESPEELEELKSCILQHKKIIEQECLLYD